MVGERTKSMTQYVVPYGGPVFGPEEREAVINAYDTGRFWDGEYTAAFERAIAKRTGTKESVFTNSGSSALLLALAALKLPPKSKVLTVALTFPTAVNIIYQTGNTPVFVDVMKETLNTTPELVEGAIRKFKPKAAIITDVIGNSPNLQRIKEILQQYEVKGIEDACDCLGGTFNGKSVGSILDIGCFSFHPAHPLSAGIGGAAVTSNPELYVNMRHFRDWGRIGQNYAKGTRFYIPKNSVLTHDKRYTYVEMGYNLMCSELHAAIGLAQLTKLDSFVATRKAIWEQTYDTLKRFYEKLILPEIEPGADPVWFGFPIIQKNPVDSRVQFMNWLEEQGIETRSIYGGPVTEQSAYEGAKYNTFGNLGNSYYLNENAFWVSCWHGLRNIQAEYLQFMLEKYLKGER